jgi:hypothetical protein
MSAATERSAASSAYRADLHFMFGIIVPATLLAPDEVIE